MLALLVPFAAAANIVGGTPTSAHPGTVAIAAISGSSGQVFCSGTVVAEGWVLTAAHCITDGEILESQFGADLYAADGADLLAGDVGTLADFVEVVVHPDYDTSSSRDYEDDLALVRVSPAIGTPVPVLAGDLTDDQVGEDITMVGYGWTIDSAYDGGTKREATVQVDLVMDGTVLTYAEGVNLCNADSGGSGYLDEDGTPVLALVPVYVQPRDTTSLCDGGATGSVRLDLHRDWIDSVVADDGGDDGGGDDGGGDEGDGDGGGGGDEGDGAGGDDGGGDDTGPDLSDTAAPHDDEDDDEAKGGCATTPAPLAALGILTGLVAVASRRRR